MKDNQLPACGAKREAFVVCGTSLTLVEWRNKRSGKELTCGCNFKDGIEFFSLGRQVTCVGHSPRAALPYLPKSHLFSVHLLHNLLLCYIWCLHIDRELSTKVTSCGCWLRWRKRISIKDVGRKKQIIQCSALYTMCAHNIL